MSFRFAPLWLIFVPVLAFAQSPELRVDGERLNATMEHMHTFGKNAEGGSDRVAYSGHNHVALGYLSGLMLESGLRPQVDVAGNLIGRRAGRIDGLAPIVAGSHIDTVPNGGHYDGMVGVMSAIEVARTLHEAGVELEAGSAVVEAETDHDRRHEGGEGEGEGGLLDELLLSPRDGKDGERAHQR